MNSKGMRWLVEAGKSLLILLLALSAVYLLGRTQFLAEASGAGQGWVSGLVGFFGGDRDSLIGRPMEGGQAAVVRPVRMAVSNERGRYGGQYDTGLVDELYSKMPNLLADALTGAGEPRQVSEQRWREALTDAAPSVYLDLLGQVPLPVLAASVGGGPSGTDLEAPVRRLLLTAGQGGEAVLYYINERDGSYYACDLSTGRDLAARLADAVEEYSPNGVLFAFEDPRQYGGLAPYTMVKQDDTPAPAAYLCANPVPIYDTDEVDGLLRDLSFHPQASQTVRTSNVLSVREGSGDSLRLYDTGVAIYHAATAEDSRFPVPGEGEVRSELELVEAAWSLVERATAGRRGEARLYLIGRDSGEEDVTLYFGYQLSGADVVVRQEGYAAKVTIRQDSVVDFTLQLRTYRAASEAAAPVLPVTQAAAAMRALGVEGSELVLSYLDAGNSSDTVSAQWVAR